MCLKICVYLNAEQEGLQKLMQEGKKTQQALQLRYNAILDQVPLEARKDSSSGVGGSGHGYNSLLKPAGEGA